MGRWVSIKIKLANQIKTHNHNLTGMYAYRCSKTALNMVSANLAVELNSESVLVTSFHPG